MRRWIEVFFKGCGLGRGVTPPTGHRLLYRYCRSADGGRRQNDGPSQREMRGDLRGTWGHMAKGQGGRLRPGNSASETTPAFLSSTSEGMKSPATREAGLWCYASDSSEAGTGMTLTACAARTRSATDLTPIFTITRPR